MEVEGGLLSVCCTYVRRLSLGVFILSIRSCSLFYYVFWLSTLELSFTISLGVSTVFDCQVVYDDTGYSTQSSSAYIYVRKVTVSTWPAPRFRLVFTPTITAPWLEELLLLLIFYSASSLSSHRYTACAAVTSLAHSRPFPPLPVYSPTRLLPLPHFQTVVVQDSRDSFITPCERPAIPTPFAPTPCT